MTARRKPDSGELEIVRWGLGTNGFRVALLVLVLSMHPLGRSILSTVGFRFPDEQKITVAAEASKDLGTKVDELSKDLARVKDDVKDVKTTVNNLQTTVSGFQVDFDKYRKPRIELQNP